MATSDSLPSVELYVRSLAPNGAIRSQNRRIQRLERLREQGYIRDVDIHVVGRGVVHESCCLETSTGRLLGDRLSTITDWAGINDAEIPGVETTTVSASPLQPTSYTITTVPRNLCLEFQSGRLQCVSPATVDETHFSVDAHFDAIEGSAIETATIRHDSTPVEVQRSGESLSGKSVHLDPDEEFVSATIGPDDNH